MNEEHPAAHLQPSVATLHSRSTLAVIALGAVMLARSWDVLVRQWSVGLLRSIPPDGASSELMDSLRNADALVDAGNVAIAITFITTAVLFLRWLHRLIVVTRSLGCFISWRPAQAVWAFFIPFISLVRPYQIVAAAHAALAPENVEPPAPRVDPTVQGGYRSVAFVQPSPAQRLPSALIGLWWGAFIVMSIGSRFDQISSGKTPDAVVTNYHGGMFVSVVAVIAAGLAITVVRGLTARAEERFRRIRESTPESLASQSISVS